MYAACLLAFVGTEAQAVDVSDLAVAFTKQENGQGDTASADSALDVAIARDGVTIVVGFVEGATGESNNGLVQAYALNGDPLWNKSYQEFIDDGTAGSNDRVESVTFDATSGRVSWCGTRGASGAGQDPRQLYFVESGNLDATDPLLQPIFEWDADSRAGGLESVDNGCFGVVQANDTVYTAGWGTGTTATAGRWATRHYDLLGTPLRQLFPDAGSVEDYPDQAFDVAARPSTGDYAMVGTQQPNLDLPAWAVRYYAVDADDPDQPLWSHFVNADNGLDAQAQAVVYNELDRRVYVAGTVNQGDENADDRDWYVVAYNDVGYGTEADVVWQYRFGTGNGTDEYATAITIDENRDIIVGGTVRDAASGNAKWRVVVLSRNTGNELSEWESPDFGADSFLQGVAFDNGRVAMVGSIDTAGGDGPDFGTLVIEADTDEDMVTDSLDACPEDPDKQDSPGVCGCGVPDADNDEDGVLNCNDVCPNDPNKTDDAGECGCNRADVDTDGDGVLNCDDNCPSDPDKVDVGICGCGTADDDVDMDGVVRCRDACPATEPGVPVNDFGCEAMDTGMPGGMTDGGGGCNCAVSATGPASGWVGLAGLALLGWRRRRDRPSPHRSETSDR